MMSKRLARLVFTNYARQFSQTSNCLNEFQYLSRDNGNKIAYRQNVSDNLDATGVVFCCGFQSTMQGIKAVAIENYCKKLNLPFVRFDYQGCGESTGDLLELTLSDWRRDVITVLDQLTAGPQVIIGSSLGGLLMLHAALARPNRIKGLIGISTAADIPERLFNRLPNELMAEVEEKGEIKYSTETHDHVITQKLLDDAPKHSLMTKDLIRVTVPVQLLHGMQDNTVPYQVSLDLAAKLKSSDVRVNFSKSADHRFAQPEDLQMLFESLNSIVEGRDKMRNLAIGSFQSFSSYSHASETQSDVIQRAKQSRKERHATEE